MKKFRKTSKKKTIIALSVALMLAITGTVFGINKGKAGSESALVSLGMKTSPVIVLDAGHGEYG